MDTQSLAQEPRIAMYGGSFDPIHRGHLAVALRAREAFGLEGVRFVPAARPPHKPGKRLASGRDRVSMLELALADFPWARVEPMELSRQGPSYTYDTVDQILEGEPELVSSIYLILGGDNLPGLPGWYRSIELLERVHPIVLRREGDSSDPVGELDGALPDWAREKLRAGFLNLPPVPGRGSAIRAAFEAGQRNLADLPAGVEDYVLQRGLYGTAPESNSKGPTEPTSTTSSEKPFKRPFKRNDAR